MASPHPIKRPPLTPDQQRLVEDHLWVARVYSRVQRSRFPQYAEDIQSEAYHGLVIAATTFDPARGCAFPTMAVKVVVSRVARFLLVTLDAVMSDARVIDHRKRRWREPAVRFCQMTATDYAMDAAAVLAELTPAHRRLLEERYGVGDHTGSTVAEMAARRGRTASATQQRCAVALKHARRVAKRLAA